MITSRIGMIPSYAHDVFVSYCWDEPDKQWARTQLAPALEAAGLDIMLDVEDFVPGHDVILEMTNANATCRHVILVLSPEYFRCNRLAISEALLARRTDPKGEGRVIPFLFRTVDLPDYLNGLVAIDWTHPEHHAREWRKLLAALAAPNVNSSPPGALRDAEPRLATTLDNALRRLDAAIAKEIFVGHSREIIAMVCRPESDGLVRVIRTDSASLKRQYSMSENDIATTPFVLHFVPSSNRLRARIEVVSPAAAAVNGSPQSIVVPRKTETGVVKFIVSATEPGDHRFCVRLLCDDEDVASTLLASEFVDPPPTTGPTVPGDFTIRIETDQHNKKVIVLAEAILNVKVKLATKPRYDTETALRGSTNTKLIGLWKRASAALQRWAEHQNSDRSDKNYR